MSLELDNGTRPPASVVASAMPDALYLSVEENLCATISQADMAELVRYWLTNTDIAKDDPRIALVNEIKSALFIAGWNSGERLQLGSESNVQRR